VSVGWARLQKWQWKSSILTIVTGLPDALLQEGTASSPLGTAPGIGTSSSVPCARPSKASGGGVPTAPYSRPLAGAGSGYSPSWHVTVPPGTEPFAVGGLKSHVRTNTTLPPCSTTKTA
jgi:hypothetical protein